MVKNEKISIAIIAAALFLFAGCVADRAPETKVPSAGKPTVLELHDFLVELPELGDFSVVRYEKDNNNATIGHDKDDTGIVIRIIDATNKWNSIERIKKDFENGKNEISEWGRGYKVKIANERTEPIGNETYAYFYKIDDKHNIIFTEYDYANGRNDKEVTRIVKETSVRPK